MDALRTQLEHMAHEGTPRGAAAVMRAARQSLVPQLHEPTPVPGRRTWWRTRRALVATCAVLLVVAAIASATLLTRGTDAPHTVLPMVSGSNEYRDLFDTSDEPLDEPVYAVPQRVPEGFRLAQVQEQPMPGGGGGSPEYERQQTWARLNADGSRVEETFSVAWGRGAPALLDRPGVPDEVRNQVVPDDPLASHRGDTDATTVRDHDGVVADGHALKLLAWEEPAGRMVSLQSETLPTETLRQIADGLVAESNGSFTVSRAPEGFVQISDQPGMTSSGSSSRGVFYIDGLGHGLHVQVDDDTQEPPGNTLAQMKDASIVDVGGRHAIAATQLQSFGGSFDEQVAFLGQPDQFVQWLEPGNSRITVSAVGIGREEMLAIARSVHTVERADWEQLLTLANQEPAFTGDESAIAEQFRTWLGSNDVDIVASVVQDGDALRSAIQDVHDRYQPADRSARVDAVRLTDTDHADVTYTLLSDGIPTLGHRQGAAVKVGGRWLVTRDTYCTAVALGGVTCPP